MKQKITFIVPVCSRGRVWKSATECPLVSTFLKSAMATITAEEFDRFDFHCKIGFDFDDTFFLNETNRDTIKKAFIAHGIDSSNRIETSFHSFTDTKHNPVMCWNHLAQLAVNDGADYLYQTGDDVEILTPGWATAFTKALQTTDNIGVAAPEDVGYHGLYTQSFVHKTHLEIMGTYYDDVFQNWYCDDYITGVYKPDYSHYLTDYKIKNTGGPQRYNADDAQPKLIEAVASGQANLLQHLKDIQDLSDDAIRSIMSSMRTVHVRYEEIAKTMTTAPAKPFWAAATTIFEGIVNA